MQLANHEILCDPHFKEGQMSVESGKQSGCPSASRNCLNINEMAKEV
jgi:hypothetical protein